MADRWMDLRPGRVITLETPDGDVSVRAEFSQGRGRRAKIHIVWPDCWGGAESLDATNDMDDLHHGEL